jgi:hypothetical protein
MIIVAALAVALQAGGEVIDRVLAIVGGGIIMDSDVALARALPIVPALWNQENADPLERLIERALVLAEVDRFAPPEPEGQVVEREVAALKAVMPAPAFEALLDRVGVSEAHLRGIVRENLRMIAYVEQRFTPPTPDDLDLERFYRAHQEQFVRPSGLPPLDEVRSEVASAFGADRRRILIAEWVAGLRRRTEIARPGSPPA